MVTQYDEKGKIFTQVISKKPVPVIIQNIAVTEASVLDDQGSPIYTCDFVTLNKEQIIWIIPDDEVQQLLG
jgi:hypothetical protein